MLLGHGYQGLLFDMPGSDGFVNDHPGEFAFVSCDVRGDCLQVSGKCGVSYLLCTNRVIAVFYETEGRIIWYDILVA